jgi:hypothetical protein
VTTDAELESFWQRQVSVGSKISGGLMGAAAALATGNPFIGAALSPYIAHGLERAGKEMIKRRLAPRQDARVGRAIVVAASLIKNRQDRGDTPRSDGFFDADVQSGRSASDEVVEASLQAAMNSAQERKIDFIATLLTNITFQSKIDISTAHLIIQMAENISYRSYALLKIMAQIEVYAFPARGGEDSPGPPLELHPLMAEIYSLARSGLVDIKDSAESNNHYAFLSADQIDPPKMFLSPLGKLLHDNLGLEALADGDPVYTEAVADLRRLGGHGTGPTTGIDGGTF